MSTAPDERGVLVWRERDDEPHTFDLVDAETGAVFDGDDLDDTVMFGPIGSV